MSKDESNKNLDDYKEKVKQSGEDLVKNVFPNRVFEVEKLINSDLMAIASKNVAEINIPVPNGNLCPPVKKRAINTNGEAGLTPVYTFPDGEVPSNESIKELIGICRPLCQRLLLEAQNVRLWIQFSIPRIEDGNNFGVGIQEEILSETSSIERDSITYLEGITRYYLARAKLVSKIAQYPHIRDYREALIEQDMKQAMGMKLTLLEIRNHYATLHDLIMKNLERIKVPRSNNSANLY